MSKFTQIPNWYWECGLDIYEVNIIARIASWQRDKKDFFESYPSLAKKFNTHVNTIKNKFKKLEAAGLIYRNGKAGRSIKWKVSDYEMNQLHKEYKTCTDTVKKTDKSNTCTNSTQTVQEIDSKSTRDRLYNTNHKTSNKTSFRVDESNDDSSPRGEIDLEAFVEQEIDI